MYYYLEVVSGIEVGRKYELNEGAATLGRRSENSVAINAGEKAVSSHHGILYRSGDSFSYQDLDSTNGSFVGDERIGECDLKVGDIIGLGQSGPRLKIISSKSELDTTYSATALASDIATQARTMRDGDPKNEAKTTRGENSGKYEVDLNAIKKGKHTPLPGYEAGSFTAEIEQKMLEQSASGREVVSLLKNRKRLQRLQQRGKLDESQLALLHNMSDIHRNHTRFWAIMLTSVAAVLLLVAGFFAIRSFQYKQLLNQAQSLEAEVNQTEQMIDRLNNAPESNKEALASLISDLDNKQLKLRSLKDNLKDDDLSTIIHDPIEAAISDIISRFGETQYSIPPQMVERVKHHVEVFSGRMNSTIQIYLNRKDQYFPMMASILSQKNLPPELCYVSMLESGLNPTALSHAGARGIWQFMPRTARQFKLKVNNSVDERLEPEKATHAAAEYFRDLIGIFGGKSSIMLAMAAYNAGEGRIMGALRKIDNPLRNRDFWYLYRMGYIPEETKEYIPKIIALIILDENRAHYGFQ